VKNKKKKNKHIPGLSELLHWRTVG